MIHLGQIIALIGFAFIGLIVILVEILQSSGTAISLILLFTGLTCILYGMLENAEFPKSSS